MMIIGKVLGVKKMNEFSNELDRIDFVTDMMFSTDFLKCISDCVFSEKASMMTVKEFYDCWKFERGAENCFLKLQLFLKILILRGMTNLKWILH